MKYRSIEKWDNPAESKNLLFFAQHVDELLFDFSLDTYKPSAMNSSLLCREAEQTYEEIKKGNIKPPNLQHVLDELSRNLERDYVAKALLKIDLSAMTPVIKNPKADAQRKRVVVELLHRQLELVAYKTKTDELLIEAIESPEAKFNEIRQLTRTYVTTLINVGYTTRHLQAECHRFFHYGPNRIANNTAIRDFLALFSTTPREYSVTFRVPDSLLTLQASFEKRGFTFHRHDSERSRQVSTINFGLTPGQVYLSIEKVSAADCYSAQTNAYKQFELLNTLYSLFHHKKGLGYPGDCVVIDKSTGELTRSKVIISAMHKCSDHVPNRAAVKLNQLISEFSLLRPSFRRFTRSAELHALALGSDSTENQMINLWIALESIIPSQSENMELANIQHIIDSITPFLSIGYLDRLVTKFTRDATNWRPAAVRRVLKVVPGSGVAEKMANAMALQDLSSVRDDLEELFADFPLLADRYEYFCNVLSRPKSVHDTLLTHTQRVSWQIRRIYRARNLIVHCGVTPSYTEILIENTHDYLDIIMGTLMRLAVKPKQIVTIEQGFEYINLLFNSHMKWFSDKASVFSEEKMSTIIGKRII